MVDGSSWPVIRRNYYVQGLRRDFTDSFGSGKRLFGETSDKKRWRLIGTQTVGDGVLILTYEPVRK